MLLRNLSFASLGERSRIPALAEVLGSATLTQLRLFVVFRIFSSSKIILFSINQPCFILGAFILGLRSSLQIIPPPPVLGKGGLKQKGLWVRCRSMT